MGVARKVGEDSDAHRGPPAHDSPSVPGVVVVHVTREDPTIGNERTLRGIPVAGIGGGAINGTRPGDSSLVMLRDEAHLIVGRMRRTRRRDHKGEI